MPRRGPSQAAITRALKGARAAGLVVRGFEIDSETGRIVIHSGPVVEQPATAFDAWKEKRDARKT